jgi:pSer/pThr/pTyr-binding forkhead associated (FHA) protein
MCITDLNSTNGTVVNGQELSPMDNIEVEVGSEVIFGELHDRHQQCSAWTLSAIVEESTTALMITSKPQ